MTVEDTARAVVVGDRPSRAEFGSDYLVEVLRALGIQYAAFNPGSSFRGLHDSLVNFDGGQNPQIVMCLHEEISVAVAHGYAKAAGRPMAAIAHNVVGLQHATMAIFNAWVDRAPMLVLGGTGPVDASHRRPWIDWIHTAHVQGNLVRDFVKWDDQPASLPAAAEALMRGYRVATTEPTGPVYLCFDTDLQEMRAPRGIAIPQVDQYVSLTKIGPDPAALDQVADLLVGSQRPVIVADLVGRSASALPSLLALAEALGAPMVDRGARFNVPTTHPLDATGAAAIALAEADVALLLDVQDPFGALTTPERITEATGFVQPPDCKVITINVNDLLVRSWTGDYQRQIPAHLAVSADTAVALPMLVERVRERLVRNAAARDHFSLRGAEWADRNRARRAHWRQEAASAAERSPLALGAIAAALWEMVRDDDWWLVNGNLNGWARRLWSWRHPHQYLGGAGGAGLGYGMGAAIGAALAARDSNRLTINLQADGDLLYTASALWTAAKYDIPMLIVIHNNRSLYNSEEHAMRMAQQRERPLENAGIGTQVRGPDVDFANLARSFGVYGEGPIERPNELRPALERALRVVKDQGKPALVDLVSEAR